jgi:hypothetical protein
VNLRLGATASLSRARSPFTLASIAALVAVPLAGLAAMSASPAHAAPGDASTDGERPWTPTTLGPVRRYDATNTPLARAYRPRWDEILGYVPSTAGPTAALGAPTIEVRRNYVYIQDTDGQLTIPYRTQNDFSASLDFALRQAFTVLPDEFTFVYLFTTFETGIGAFFYAPQANTDRGIGQQVFDQTGPSPLEGFVFMNDWKSFDQQFPGAPRDVIDGFARSVFNQEAGHRWGVQFDSPASAQGLNPLLGRDDAHWSYFAETGGSPMEGNAWRDNGDGTFTTVTDVRKYNYSDVDLYLMGLIPPDQVRPWFLITRPNTTGLRDIYNQALNAASPPQVISPLRVRGTRQDYTVDDLTGALGARRPAAGQAPTRWRVAFVVLAGQRNGFDENEKFEFEEKVDMYADGFHDGTRGLGTLDYTLMGEPPKASIGDACASSDECDAAQATLCAVPGAGSTQAICTKPCANRGECPSAWCCGLGQDTSLGNICLPNGQCAEPPDAGIEPDGGAAPDGGAVPDGGAALDGGDGGEAICACDTTTACSAGCACDPECRARPDVPSGCSVGGSRDDLAVVGAAGLFALAFARRRRAR